MSGKRSGDVGVDRLVCRRRVMGCGCRSAAMSEKGHGMWVSISCCVGEWSWDVGVDRLVCLRRVMGCVCVNEAV